MEYAAPGFHSKFPWWKAKDWRAGIGTLARTVGRPCCRVEPPGKLNPNLEIHTVVASIATARGRSAGVSKPGLLFK